MNESGRAFLLEIAGQLPKNISIPVKTNVGIGTQFQYSVIGPWIFVKPIGHEKENPLQARRETLNLLDDFYSDQKRRPTGTRLIVRRIGVFGGFLISAQDSDVIDILAPELREEEMGKHLAEFKRFGKYLADNSLIH